MSDIYREAARDRRVVNEAKAAEIKAVFESANDLFTTCQHCHERISGSLIELKAHVEQCKILGGHHAASN